MLETPMVYSPTQKRDGRNCLPGGFHLVKLGMGILRLSVLIINLMAVSGSAEIGGCVSQMPTGKTARSSKTELCGRFTDTDSSKFAGRRGGEAFCVSYMKRGTLGVSSREVRMATQHEPKSGRQTLDEVREISGWREHDRFLFGYGALLSSDVWRQRGIDESLGGRRRALRAVAQGRTLRFNVKGGWASTEPLVNHPDQPPFQLSSSNQPEAHGIIVPLSSIEIMRHADKEAGYILLPVIVRLYGSSLELNAVTFVSSFWRRTAVDLKPSARYLNLIIASSISRQLDSNYTRWLQETFQAATAAEKRIQDAIFTPSDAAGWAVMACALTGLACLFSNH